MEPSTSNGTPVVSIDLFKEEVQQPAKPAVDNGTPLEPPPGEEWNQPFIMPDIPEGAQPIFPDDASAPPPPAGPPPPLTPKQAGMPLHVFLKWRNILQTRLLVFISKSNNPEKYRLDAEDLDMLTEAWAPYAEQFGGYIPPWVIVLAVELMTTGTKVMQALNDRKVNRDNERLAASETVHTTINRTAASTNKERTSWQIDGKGYYMKDIFGNYINAVDRTEKAHLKDIQNLVEKNGEDRIRKIFNIKDLSQHGYKEESE